jgi:hypothetical protein
VTGLIKDWRFDSKRMTGSERLEDGRRRGEEKGDQEGGAGLIKFEEFRREAWKHTTTELSLVLAPRIISKNHPHHPPAPGLSGRAAAHVGSGSNEKLHEARHAV